MIVESLGYLVEPNNQFVLPNGATNVAGIVRVYYAGTDDLAKTYCNFEGTRNPADIRLDNNGRAIIIADVTKVYRIEVCDSNGGLLWTVEPAYCIGGEGGGEGSIDEIAMFDLSQAGHGLYDDIDANLVAGLLPIIYTGSQGAVRYYYYTARDSQAHTMTFTCGYDGSVELLVLKNDDTYTFKKVGSDYLLACGSNTFDTSDSAAPLSQVAKGGDSIWIDDDGVMHAKAGVYHVDYDARAHVASQDGDVCEDAVRHVSPELSYYDGFNNNLVDVDLTYRHAVHINKSLDIKLNAERTISFRMQDVGGIVRYTLLGLQVFKISE